MEVALDPQSPKPHTLQPAGLQFGPRRVDRHERHAEPGHHGLLDGFRVSELERPADSEARALKRPLRERGRQVFSAAGVPIGKSYSSRFYRAAETARLIGEGTAGHA